MISADGKQHMQRIIFLLIFGTLLVVSNATLSAKKIPPDKVDITTPVYAPELTDFNPKLGKYIYAVSWQGIPAGTVELNLTRVGDDYQITASARSAKAIDYVYKLRYKSEAVISAKTLMPKHSIATTNENFKEKKIELEFSPEGEIQSVYINHRGKRQSLQFKPHNFTLEPFSTAFLALSMNWKKGDKRTFDTYNGRNRYLIELTAVDMTDIIINGATHRAIVIAPAVTKLTDAETKKLRKAWIYISAGNSREILQITSELFFGSVNTTLVDFIPEKNILNNEKPSKGSSPKRIESAPAIQ